MTIYYEDVLRYLFLCWKDYIQCFCAYLVVTVLPTGDDTYIFFSRVM